MYGSCTHWLNKSYTMKVKDIENEIKTVFEESEMIEQERKSKGSPKTTCETQDVIIVSLDTVKW